MLFSIIYPSFCFIVQKSMMTYSIGIHADMIYKTHSRDTHCLISYPIVNTYKICFPNIQVDQSADKDTFFWYNMYGILINSVDGCHLFMLYKSASRFSLLFKLYCWFSCFALVLFLRPLVTICSL